MQFRPNGKEVVTAKDVALHIVHCLDDGQAFAGIVNEMARELEEIQSCEVNPSPLSTQMTSAAEGIAGLLTPEGIEFIRAIDRRALLPEEK